MVRSFFGGTLKAESRSVHDRLGRCRTAALFAATIGPALDDWCHELMDADQMTRALLANAYGSAAAIALGLAVETIVTGIFEKGGLQPTKRYAPGYGDWSLTDQTPLFALLDAYRIGIRLTEDHLMIPAKSISGVIGGATSMPKAERRPGGSS